MDIGSMQQSTQEAVKKKFGRKRLLTSKVVTHYPENLEREYIRLTNSYMSLFSNTLKTYLPKIRATLEDYEHSGLITDAADDENESDTPPVTHSVAIMALTNIKLERLFAEVLADFEKRQNNFNVASRIEKLSNLTRKLTVKEWKRVVKNTLGIGIMEDYYNGAKFQRLFDSWIADNVAKIKAIPNETIASMRDIVKQGYLNGVPAVKRDFTVQRKLKDGTVTNVTLHSKQPTIAEQIQEAYNISKEHAQLIARDQMAKLNAQISQEQMNDAGVTEYVWRAVNDGRTRDCHKSLNGKRFKFAVGAEQWYDTKSKGRVSTGYANPGEYYQCRCVALPVFDFDTVVLPWEKGETK